MKKLISTTLAAILFFAVCLYSAGCAAAGYTVFEPICAFSDDILFSAQIMGGRAQYAYEGMKKVISAIDSEVSATRGSYLTRFNNAGQNVRVEVGEHCYKLFELSKKYYELTDGAFNPAAAPLVELWQVDAATLSAIKNGEALPVLPTPEQVEAALSYCDLNLIRGETEGGKYYLTKLDSRVKLDFGAIAKGYAVDKCVEVLDSYDIKSALIDISGNAYLYGDHVSSGKGSMWNVGVVSPRPRESFDRGYVCAIEVGGGTSAVTSGDYMRYYSCESGGNTLFVTHIIGKNGVPVGVEYDGQRWVNSTDWVVSATVLGKSSAMCDALSTAVAASGLTEGAALLQKLSCKGLIFTEKRYTIINGVALYRPDVYSGYSAYEYYEP